MQIDLSKKKLGKLAPVYDPRTLRLAKYLTSSLPPPPPARQWSAAIPMPCGEFLNDKLGCCVIAAIGHLIQAVTANTNGEVTVSDADIEAAYEAVSGYVAGDPGTDNGCVLLDALNYWRHNGVGGHKILAFASVSTLNLTHMQMAIEYFGGVIGGLALPQSAQAQIGSTWDLPPGGPVGPGAL